MSFHIDSDTKTPNCQACDQSPFPGDDWKWPMHAACSRIQPHGIVGSLNISGGAIPAPQRKFKPPRQFELLAFYTYCTNRPKWPRYKRQEPGPYLGCSTAEERKPNQPKAARRGWLPCAQQRLPNHRLSDKMQSDRPRWSPPQNWGAKTSPRQQQQLQGLQATKSTVGAKLKKMKSQLLSLLWKKSEDVKIPNPSTFSSDDCVQSVVDKAGTVPGCSYLLRTWTQPRGG